MQVPRCKSLHHKLMRDNCGECAPPAHIIVRAKDGARPPLTLAFWPLPVCLSGLHMGMEHGNVASAKWMQVPKHHKLMRENCGVRAAQSA